MTPTNVGMRCPECAKQRTKVVRMREMSRVPRVTYALIAINVVVFLAEQGQFTLSGSTVGGKVVDEGVIYRAAISEGHQYWRLLTNAFLHENLLHIFFNMYLLYLLGNMLEPAIGSVKFAAIYLASLFAASFGVLLWSDGISLGASGAVFGVMGATAVELRARGHRLTETGIGALIVINLIFSFLVPDISIGAHLGGLIGGVLAGLALRAADDRRMPSSVGVIACVAIAAGSIVGSLAVAGASGTGFA
jgi:membrane associated rhomboid family serine protease